MTQEQKAKAYDEALERMKQVVIVPKDEKALQALKETIFPELRENEDERIRKKILDIVRTAPFDEEKDILEDWLEKQKENPQSADSIHPDCVSNVKYGERWHKVGDSLPDNGRLVLANDCLGNTLLARYDGEGNWEVSVYDNDDYYCRNTITKWCEIPSEKQKEIPTYEKLERVVKAARRVLNNWLDGTDCPDVSGDFGELEYAFRKYDGEEKQKEQKPVECIKFGNEFENQISHLIASVLNGEYEYSEGFVKYVAQSLLGYAKNEQKPAEWSEEDEKIYQTVFEHFNSYRKYTCSNGVKREHILSWLKSLRPQKNISYGELPLVSIDYMEGLDTEFEKQVGAVIASAMNREHQFTSKYIKWVAQGLLECAKREQNSAEEYVSENFDDIWTTEECDELISEGNKLTPNFKKLFKNICHAWYDKGIEKEKKN